MTTPEAIAAPVRKALYDAIRSGDVPEVEGLLADHPGLAGCRLGGKAGRRTPLHVVTDWPGFLPHAPEIAALLIASGAEVDVRGEDGTGETPLHWAASSDDTEVARVLIDAGADVEAADGSIGTPLDNAVGYACWDVARLLVARGAGVDRLWQAAALGLLDRLRELLSADPVPDPAAIDQAFWHACAGGQRHAAELLLEHGADPSFVPEYGQGSVVDIARNGGTGRGNLVTWLEEQTASGS